MILNLLRANDLSVEDMIKRSFSEFHAQKALSANDLSRALRDGEARLRRTTLALHALPRPAAVDGGVFASVEDLQGCYERCRASTAEALVALRRDRREEYKAALGRGRAALVYAPAVAVAGARVASAVGTGAEVAGAEGAGAGAGATRERGDDKARSGGGGDKAALPALPCPCPAILLSEPFSMPPTASPPTAATPPTTGLSAARQSLMSTSVAAAVAPADEGDGGGDAVWVLVLLPPGTPPVDVPAPPAPAAAPAAAAGLGKPMGKMADGPIGLGKPMGKMADGPGGLGKPMGKMADMPSLGKPMGKAAGGIGGLGGKGSGRDAPAGAAPSGAGWEECSGYLPEPSSAEPRAFWLRRLRVADIGLLLRCRPPAWQRPCWALSIRSFRPCPHLLPCTRLYTHAPSPTNPRTRPVPHPSPHAA